MPCYKSPFCVFWACNRKKRLPKVSSIYIRCTSEVCLAHYDREALHLELGGLCDDQNHCWSIAGGRTYCRSNAVLLILYVLRKCLSSDGHFYNISVESLPWSTSKPINNLFINLADLCKNMNWVLLYQRETLLFQTPILIIKLCRILWRTHSYISVVKTQMRAE